MLAIGSKQVRYSHVSIITSQTKTTTLVILNESRTLKTKQDGLRFTTLCNASQRFTTVKHGKRLRQNEGANANATKLRYCDVVASLLRHNHVTQQDTRIVASNFALEVVHILELLSNFGSTFPVHVSDKRSETRWVLVVFMHHTRTHRQTCTTTTCSSSRVAAILSGERSLLNQTRNVSKKITQTFVFAGFYPIWHPNWHTSKYKNPLAFQRPPHATAKLAKRAEARASKRAGKSESEREKRPASRPKQRLGPTDNHSPALESRSLGSASCGFRL